MKSDLTYVTTFTGVTTTYITGSGQITGPALDLFTIIPTVPIKLLWVNLSVNMNFSPNTLRISYTRMTPSITLGSGNLSVIPVEKSQISGILSSSLVQVLATPTSSYTRTTTTGIKQLIWLEAFCELDSYNYLPIPAVFDSISAGDALVVGLENGDNIVLNGSICWQELT